MSQTAFHFQARDHGHRLMRDTSSLLVLEICKAPYHAAGRGDDAAYADDGGAGTRFLEPSMGELYEPWTRTRPVILKLCWITFVSLREGQLAQK